VTQQNCRSETAKECQQAIAGGGIEKSTNKKKLYCGNL